MWELDHKEGWMPKNWCFQIVVLEKNLASPLNSKVTKPVNSKGNQLWILSGRTDAEAKAPIVWPLDAKNWLLGKDPVAGKDRRQEERGRQRMMASLTGWTWIWASSGSWWWTGRPGVLQSMGSQTAGHSSVRLNWTELNCTELIASESHSVLIGS